MGGFGSLSDPEKQFLILKSLLLMGGRGGGMLIDEEQWFNLSPSFRARAENLARSLSAKDLSIKNRAIYLAPHLWSSDTSQGLWRSLWNSAGVEARVVSSIDYILKEREARAVIVDPGMILTKEAVQKLLSWCRHGTIVVFPRSALYTEPARVEIDNATHEGSMMNIHLGISYRLHSLKSGGKMIIYEVPDELSNSTQVSQSKWQQFVSSVLSVAEIKKEVSVSDGRLSLITLDRRQGGIGLFIFNGSNRSVAGDILFSGEVRVSDLTQSLAGQATNEEAAIPSSRFGLEVPPCGVLPIAVDGLGQEADERRAAALTSGLMKEHAFEAALGELPGLNSNDDMSQFMELK